MTSLPARAFLGVLGAESRQERYTRRPRLREEWAGGDIGGKEDGMSIAGLSSGELAGWMHAAWQSFRCC